mmetsp:Transcript_20022/g.46615  ORF Transcript_20022/g.46615 Transcript_20022/m.46615 type:complete len:207 (+) Transcript_20022:299-919(+)
MHTDCICIIEHLTLRGLASKVRSNVWKQVESSLRSPTHQIWDRKQQFQALVALRLKLHDFLVDVLLGAPERSYGCMLCDAGGAGGDLTLQLGRHLGNGLRSRQITKSISSHGKRLGETVHCQRSIPHPLQGCKGDMAETIICDALIDLVREHQNVLKLRSTQQRSDCLLLLMIHGTTRRIAWIVPKEQPSLWRQDLRKHVGLDNKA